MKRKDVLVNQGGLYRCCLQSIVDWKNENPEADAVEGERFACRYEREHPAEMVVACGVVQWYDPDYPPLVRPK